MKTNPAISTLLAALMSGATISQSAAQITVGGNGANTTDSTSYSGAQSLTKIGSNTVTLTGGNTYTGGTNINAGALNLGGGSSTGGNFTIGNGATLQATASSFWFNGTPRFSFTANGGGTIDTSSGVNFIMGGSSTYTSAGGAQNLIKGSSGINLNSQTATLDVARGTDATSDLLITSNFWNNGSLVKTGNGIATLAGNNSYSGSTTISAGTLQVGNGGTTGSLGNSSGVSNNAALVFNRSDNGLNAGNPISGSGSVTKIGAGTVTLSGNNTYTGGTTIHAGTLTLSGGSSSPGSTGVGPYTIGNGATLRVTASTFWFNGTPSFNFTADGGGTIDTSSGVNFIMGGSSTYTSAGGAQNLIKGSSGINLTRAGEIATFNVARGTDTDSDLLVTSSVSGAGGITKSGSGILTFSEINSFSGGLTVNAGIVNVSASTPLTDSASGSGSSNNAIVVNDGATLRYTAQRGAGYHSANATINGGTVTFDADDMNFAVGKTLTFDSQAGTINGTGQWRRRDAGNSIVVTAAASGSIISVADLNLLDGSPEFNVADGVQSADLTVSSSITGGAALRKTGAGMMVLSGNNSYSGTTTISAGALQIGNGGTNGTLGTGAVTNNASLVFNRANALAVANVISGTGSVAQNGAGVTTLAASNTYTGGTTVNAGTLALGAANRLADSGAVTVNAGAFDLGGFSETVGAVTLAGGSITNGTLTGSAYGVQSGTVGAVLAGNAALTKNSTGTVTLSEVNTYTGATTVQAGQLTVDGSITSTATVQSGARIGGSGRVGGLILDSGSTLAPGNSPGSLSVTGDATWNSGANYNWQVLATNTNPAVQTGAGTGWDFLDVTGTLTLSGLDSSNRFNLNLWSLSSTSPDTNGTIPGWDASVGSTWLIASAAGGINLDGTTLAANTNYSSLFNINTAATNGTGGWIGALPSNFQVLTLGDANALYLQAVAGSAAVPEPGQIAASALLLIGIGGYVWLKRRKAAKAVAPAVA